MIIAIHKFSIQRIVILKTILSLVGNNNMDILEHSHCDECDKDDITTMSFRDKSGYGSHIYLCFDCLMIAYQKSVNYIGEYYKLTTS